MFRVPIWRMSAYSATMSTWFGSMTSVITGRPGPVARLGEVAERLDARGPGSCTGDVRGLNAPPRRIVAPGRRDRVGRLEQLVAALDRARPGHHRQRRRRRSTASRTRMTVSSGWNSREVSLNGRLIGVTVSTPGSPPSRLISSGLRGPTSPTTAMTVRSDARVVVRRQALGEDVALHAEDLGLGGGPGHHDEHRWLDPSCPIKQKSRGRDLCFSRHDPRSRVLGSGIGHAGRRK